MDVYIEDAIFDTTTINLAILYLTEFALRQKTKFIRILFSALIGCVISILLTFFTFPQWVTIISKFLCGLIMCAIVLPKFSFKLLLLFFVVFLSFTCLIGGFCFFIIYLFGGEVYSLASMSYNLPISLGLITLFIWAYIYFLVNIIKIFYKKQKLEKFFYDIKIWVNCKSIKLKAYLDSGNLLQDPQTNLPVLILNLKTFLKLFEHKISVVDFLNHNLAIKLNGRYIEFYSVGKKENIFVFEPQKVQLIEKNKSDVRDINVLIGVSANNLANANFEALLSPLCI